MNKEQLSRLLSLALTDDTRSSYIVSEATYYILGKKAKPAFIRHEGKSHWLLRDKEGNVIDFTASQFNSAPDYSEARGKGLMTKKPSKRAQVLINRLRALDKLSELFKPEAFEKVIKTPNAKLGGLSPLELILSGKQRRALDYYRKMFSGDQLVNASLPETIASKVSLGPIIEKETSKFLQKMIAHIKKVMARE